MRAPRLASFIYGLSVAAAIAASLYFVVWPTYPDGQTLIDANGPRVLLPLNVPLIVTGLPGLAPAVAVLLLTAAVVLAGARAGQAKGTYPQAKLP